MRPSKAHFVTSCQQLLALGAVLAVLTPAASVISLDVVGRAPAPGATAGHGHPVELTAYTRETTRPARVPTAPVDAEVTDYPLTAPRGVSGRREVAARTVADPRHGTTEVVSRPQPVTGFGGVGVTWDPAARVSEDQLGLEVRTRDADGGWSAWAPLEYDADHGPDPASAEGRNARPGTDVLFVGEVDEVQVRATAEDTAPPADMKLSVVSPGEPADTARELPDIDTAEHAEATAIAARASTSAATKRLAS